MSIGHEQPLSNGESRIKIGKLNYIVPGHFVRFIIIFYSMAELVHGEKEHSDWLPKRSVFCYIHKIDHSQTDFTDLCS